VGWCYQDVQQRIKDQQFPNRDLPRKGEEKVDITIVVDMLLTGFDAKFLNTLCVDKNLKHHGLIQAFSRTNRILNATKPYGHILDFRSQQDSVDAAIALFSGAQADRAREIWLVDKAPVAIDNFKQAVADLGEFMHSQGLQAKPDGGIKWVSLADSKRPDHGLISETAIEISEEGIKNSSAVLHPAGSVILSRDAGVGKTVDGIQGSREEKRPRDAGHPLF
jgi:hypothetical protein